MNDFMQVYVQEYISVLENLDQENLIQLYDLLKEVRDEGNNIFVLGNGGSSSNADHWVCDFNKGTACDNVERFKMIAPSNNLATLTAYANDVSYEMVFVEQIKNFLQKDDLVIVFSVSGNSMNIVNALEYAQNNGAKTVSIIGDYDGLASKYSDLTWTIPSKNYGIVEDVCMNIGHILSQYFMYKSKENA